MEVSISIYLAHQSRITGGILPTLSPSTIKVTILSNSQLSPEFSLPLPILTATMLIEE